MSRTSADAMGSPSEEQDCGECYNDMLPEGQDAAYRNPRPRRAVEGPSESLPNPAWRGRRRHNGIQIENCCRTAPDVAKKSCFR